MFSESLYPDSNTLKYVLAPCGITVSDISNRKFNPTFPPLPALKGLFTINVLSPNVVIAV